MRPTRSPACDAGGDEAGGERADLGGELLGGHGRPAAVDLAREDDVSGVGRGALADGVDERRGRPAMLDRFGGGVLLHRGAPRRHAGDVARGRTLAREPPIAQGLEPVAPVDLLVDMPTWMTQHDAACPWCRVTAVWTVDDLDDALPTPACSHALPTACCPCPRARSRGTSPAPLASWTCCCDLPARPGAEGCSVRPARLPAAVRHRAGTPPAPARSMRAAERLRRGCATPSRCSSLPEVAVAVHAVQGPAAQARGLVRGQRRAVLLGRWTPTSRRSTVLELVDGVRGGRPRGRLGAARRHPAVPGRAAADLLLG